VLERPPGDQGVRPGLVDPWNREQFLEGRRIGVEERPRRCGERGGIEWRGGSRYCYVVRGGRGIISAATGEKNQAKHSCGGTEKSLHKIISVFRRPSRPGAVVKGGAKQQRAGFRRSGPDVAVFRLHFELAAAR